MYKKTALSCEQNSVFSALAIMLGVFMLYSGFSIAGWGMVVSGILWNMKTVKNVCDLNEDLWSPKKEMIYLGLIMLMAAFLRLWQISNLPPGCWFDEAENGLKTISLINGEMTLFNPRNNGSGTLFYFWCVPFFKLFGSGVLALRLASVALSLLSIFVLWVFTRSVFGKNAAIISAFIIAFSGWHLVLSRVGFDAMLTLLLELLALVIIYQAVRLANTRLYILSGFVIGLAQYGYIASRLSILILFVFIMTIMFYKKMPISKKGLLLGAVAFVVTILPLLKIAIKEPEIFWKRTVQVSLVQDILKMKNPGALAKNTRSAIRMLHEKGDKNLRHNILSRPLLNPMTGTLFVLGLIFLFRNKKEPIFLFLMIWMAMIIFAGTVLTKPAPHALRTIAALAPITIISALGLIYFLGQIKKTPQFQELTIIFVAGIMAGMVYSGYFQEYAVAKELRTYFSSQAYWAGQIIRKIPDAEKIYLGNSMSKSVAQFAANKSETDIIVFDPEQQIILQDRGVVITGSESENSYFKNPGYSITAYENKYGDKVFMIKKVETNEWE